MGALRDDLPHYTYDDYKIWEGNWELIDGIAYAMAPSPIFEHQDISSKISYETLETLGSVATLKIQEISKKFLIR